MLPESRGVAEIFTGRHVSGHSAFNGVGITNFPDCGSAPSSLEARNTSVQLLQLSGLSNPTSGRLLLGEELSVETQHSALISSIATWLPGAMQSTEDELGKSSNATARMPMALLMLFPANPPSPLFMPFPYKNIVRDAFRLRNGKLPHQGGCLEPLSINQQNSRKGKGRFNRKSKIVNS